MNRKALAATLIALVALSGTALAAPDPQITVMGTAQIKAKPDIAYAIVQVVAQDRVQATAVTADAARTLSVIEALKHSTIADRDIETQWYSVQPQYDYSTTPPAFHGYQASNTIKVTIHDVTKAGLILDKVVAAGATSVNGPTFDLEDRSKQESLALIEAIRNARAKADLVAGAAGVQVGKVLSVTENEANNPEPVTFAANSHADAASAPTTPIQEQEIVIDANVTISYAIQY